MANTDAYVNLTGGTAKLQDSADERTAKNIGKVTLEYNDTLTVKLGSGFGASPSISKVSVYNWSDYDKANKVPVGVWQGGSQTIGVLSVGASGSDVVITDGDEGQYDGDYGYAVTVADGTDYTADPELLAKKKSGGGNRTIARPTSRPRAPEADV